MFFGIIPARMESTRFYGKPMYLINGVPMIRRVYDGVYGSLDGVVAAVDKDLTLAQICVFNEIPTCVVFGDVPTGTDRCYLAAKMLGLSSGVVVNIQGDEPLITRQHMWDLMNLFDDPKVGVGTLVYEAEDCGTEDDVKVQFDGTGKIYNFTRIDGSTPKYYKHIGVIGFRLGVLADFYRLGVSEREKKEHIELLRCLDNGISVHCRVSTPTIAVDRPEDIKRVEACLKTRS